MKYVLAGIEEIKHGGKETEKWWHRTSKESLRNGKNTLKVV